MEAKNNQPIKELLLYNWKNVILVVLIASFWGGGYYSTFVWLPFFMTEKELIGEKNVIGQTWLISLCLNMLLVIALPMGGLLGDFAGNLMRSKYKGTISIMQLALCIAGVVIVPAYWVINNNSRLSFSYSSAKINYRIWIVAIAQLCLCVPLTLFGGNLPAFMVSQFQPRLRYSGIGLAYNSANAIFSGTVPIILTALAILSKHTIEQIDDSGENSNNEESNNEQRRYLRETNGTAFAWFDTKQFLPLLPSIYLLSLIMVAAVALAIAKRKEPMQ